ncbi:hypothetical protein [Methylobacterium sp. E-066]|uniref:hypothetical protein n=1 Tax=Methylobacterium sp. E-066 TaxID=2836584 RepID=UPI001FB8DA90|nr:hypothetical protein [Methylobacterium sp. E-066]MCJ2142944.1 hypothetical protein [Methylobacterium sp. E-066]
MSAVLADCAVYQTAGAAIRGARLTGYAKIDAAATAETARAVLAALASPTFG